MKKLFFTITLLVVYCSLQAQWTDSGSNLTTSDNVGIGISSPDAKLHITDSAIGLSSTNSIDANLIIQGTSSGRNMSEGAAIGFVIPANTNGSNHWQQGRILVTPDNTNNSNASGRMYLQTRFYDGAWSWKNNLVLLSSGKVGIGVNSPNEMLDVEGDAEFGNNTGLLKISQGDLTYEGNERSYLFHDRSTNRKIGLGIIDNGAKQNYIELFEGNNPGNQYIDFGVYGNSAMRINSSGKVGIGTTSTGSHKLAVDGSIGAREIKVEAGTGWSDFVFNESYNLRTLEATEQYISKNNHLPDIPSEAEVKENGINLGEMDAKLLQKIEELTLYLIRQNKRLDAQQKEIEKLKAQIKN